MKKIISVKFFYIFILYSRNRKFKAKNIISKSFYFYFSHISGCVGDEKKQRGSDVFSQYWTNFSNNFLSATNLNKSSFGFLLKSSYNVLSLTNEAMKKQR